MKSTLNTMTIDHPPRVKPRKLAPLIALATLFYVLRLDAQVVKFDGGKDIGFYRYDPIALAGAGPVGTWTFPGNDTYRIQSATSPNPVVLGPGRAGSVYAGVTYTDFYVSVDLVGWNHALDQAMGILARVTSLGPGTADGYSMTYQPSDNDLSITRFTDESPAGGILQLAPLTLTPGRSYRFIFSGTGTTLRARVFDLANPGVLLADMTANDASYSSGECGLIVFDNTAAAVGTADATFDNYRATGVESPELSVALGSGGDLAVSWTTQASYFILQANPDLYATNWVDIPPPYQTSGAEFFHMETVPTASPEKYYRLRLP